MFKIIHIPQVWIEVSHHAYYRPGSLVTLVTILNGLDMVNHLLDIPSIFR